MNPVYGTNSQQYTSSKKQANIEELMKNGSIIVKLSKEKIESMEWFNEEYGMHVKVTSTNEKSLHQLEEEITPVLEKSYIEKILNKEGRGHE